MSVIENHHPLHGPRKRASRAKKAATSSHPHPRSKPRARRPVAPAHLARYLTILGVCLVVVSLVAVFALALHKHVVNEHAAEARAKEADKGPHVLMAKATMSPGEHDFTLPAEVRGYFQTTAYAKVSGYVRDVRVDKGDHVKKGQVLGTVESPETDQQVRAAASDLTLRKQLYGRARFLAPNVVSYQDLQTASANLDVSKAQMQGALALQGYETIRAPFDGIVTARYVNPGALMPAATGSTTSAQPFVDIADPERLRIEAYVGQEEALFIHPGDPVSVSQNDGTSHVDATVTRTAGSLDPRTRTMLCEIELDNRKGLLLPGALSQITFHIESPPLPRVPSEAVVIRDGQELLGVVKDDHIHLAKVQTGVTDGKTTQIVSGLQGGEMVALNVPAELVEGSAVQATERPSAPSDASGGGGASDAGAPEGETAK